MYGNTSAAWNMHRRLIPRKSYFLRIKRPHSALTMAQKSLLLVIIAGVHIRQPVLLVIALATHLNF